MGGITGGWCYVRMTYRDMATATSAMMPARYDMMSTMRSIRTIHPPRLSP